MVALERVLEPLAHVRILAQAAVLADHELANARELTAREARFVGRVAVQDRRDDTAAVELQHVETVRDDGAQCIEVDRLRSARERRARRYLLDAGEPKPLERADVEPADIELPPFVRELRGGAICVMVVVELLAADQHAERPDVARRVLRLEVAVTPVVADTVDDAGGPERNPDHLDCVDRKAGQAEQQQIDEEHDQHAQMSVLARVYMALDPVVGCASAVDLQRLLVPGLGLIEPDAAEQHSPDSVELRAVRVFLGFATRMVLAVDRDPLARDHAGRQPEPEPEEVADDGMQREPAVGLMAVQEDRDARDRDVRQDKRHGDVAPEREIPPAVERHTKLPLSLRAATAVSPVRGPSLSVVRAALNEPPPSRCLPSS